MGISFSSVLLKEMFPYTCILKGSPAQSLCGSLAASAARYSLMVALIIKISLLLPELIEVALAITSYSAQILSSL